MKKSKSAIRVIALFLGIGAAFAFNTNAIFPGDLYWINPVTFECERSPCETLNQTGDPCPLVLYQDAGCTTRHTGPAFWTAFGKF